MPAIGTTPIYEMSIIGTLPGKASNNVLYFVNDGLSPAANGSQLLNDRFVIDVWPDWSQLVSDNYTMVELSTRRLNSITDFWTTPVGLSGTQIADNSNRFVAYQIKKNRTTKESRSGWINIGGVVETATLPSGDVLDTTFANLLGDVAVSLGSNLVSGNDIFQIVLVGNKYVPGTSPRELKPESDWTWQRISSLVTNGRTTSQVSRK